MSLIRSGYAATFSAVEVTAAQDLFEITAPSDKRVVIHLISFGQSSDFGDAAAEGLSVKFLRGHTTSGSGGSTVTPAALHPSDSAADSVVEANNTTAATGGSPVTLYSTGFKVQNGFIWRAVDALGPFLLSAGQRFVVNLTAPADALTMSGTMIFQEIADGDWEP